MWIISSFIEVYWHVDDQKMMLFYDALKLQLMSYRKYSTLKNQLKANLNANHLEWKLQTLKKYQLRFLRCNESALIQWIEIIYFEEIRESGGLIRLSGFSSFNLRVINGMILMIISTFCVISDVKWHIPYQILIDHIDDLPVLMQHL